MQINERGDCKSQTGTTGSVDDHSEPEESNPWLAGPDMQAQVQARSCLIRCATPPPASRPDALLPSPFTPGLKGISHPGLEKLPASPPNPLLLTSLPPCPSSRLSCSPMPFLKRYSAADLLDTAPRRYRRLGRVLGVAFGVSLRLGALLRAFRAPALPDRRPGRRSSASGRPGRWPGSSLRSPLPPHRSALARISMLAKTCVLGVARGASRALRARTVMLYHGCVCV